MKLGHLALLVPDYDAALAFFVGGLGWTCTEDIPQGDKRWVTVLPPGGGTGLVIARAVGAQVEAIGQQFGGRVGLFLHCEDFEAAAKRIEAASGRFEETPRQEPYGIVAVWQDPWGNRWDLIEPK